MSDLLHALVQAFCPAWQNMTWRRRSGGTLLQMIADAIVVLVRNAGDRMLHYRFPGDLAENLLL